MVDTIVNLAILGGVGYLAYEYYANDGDLCKNSIIGLAPVCMGKGAIGFFKKTQDIGVGVPIGLEGCRDGYHEFGLICKKDGYCEGDWRKPVWEEGHQVCHVEEWEGRLNHGGTCRPDHPDRVDGLCYKSCPKGWVHVGGMPYLCRDGKGGNFWDATGGAYLKNIGSWLGV